MCVCVCVCVWWVTVTAHAHKHTRAQTHTHMYVYIYTPHMLHACKSQTAYLHVHTAYIHTQNTQEHMDTHMHTPPPPPPPPHTHTHHALHTHTCISNDTSSQGTHLRTQWDVSLCVHRSLWIVRSILWPSSKTQRGPDLHHSQRISLKSQPVSRTGKKVGRGTLPTPSNMLVKRELDVGS